MRCLPTLAATLLAAVPMLGFAMERGGRDANRGAWWGVSGDIATTTTNDTPLAREEAVLYAMIDANRQALDQRQAEIFAMDANAPLLEAYVQTLLNKEEALRTIPGLAEKNARHQELDTEHKAFLATMRGGGTNWDKDTRDHYRTLISDLRAAQNELDELLADNDAIKPLLLARQQAADQALEGLQQALKADSLYQKLDKRQELLENRSAAILREKRRANEQRREAAKARKPKVEKPTKEDEKPSADDF